MKYDVLTLIMQAPKITVFTLFMSLYACAGEGTSTTPVDLEHSSLLADNKLPTESNFSNFRKAVFTFDPSLVQMNGYRLFLKLSRQGGKVVYLGEINRHRPFSIELELLLVDTHLLYEIFTDDGNDDTQIGVVNL